MSSPIDEVLSFWFGSVAAVHTGEVPKENRSRWFSADEQTDSHLRSHFGEHVEKAGRGHYDEWADDSAGRLALIVLLDQFSRNIHRGTPRAFAFDDRALKHALDGIDRGHDQVVAPIARVFFYLPLEHAEELGHQQRCVELMEELVEDAPRDRRELFEDFLHYAREHRDTIARFGRFPHRNPILDRTSTPEEQEYLEEEDANSWGQDANS